MDVEKLRKIEHMLRTDEHVRRHWYYGTILSHHARHWADEFKLVNREVPCGAIGCAWGWAKKRGIVHESETLRTGATALELSNHDFDAIFDDSPYSYGVDHIIEVTPDMVADRIVEVINGKTFDDDDD